MKLNELIDTLQTLSNMGFKNADINVEVAATKFLSHTASLHAVSTDKGNITLLGAHKDFVSSLTPFVPAGNTIYRIEIDPTNENITRDEDFSGDYYYPTNIIAPKGDFTAYYIQYTDEESYIVDKAMFNQDKKLILIMRRRPYVRTTVYVSLSETEGYPSYTDGFKHDKEEYIIPFKHPNADDDSTTIEYHISKVWYDGGLLDGTSNLGNRISTGISVLAFNIDLDSIFIQDSFENSYRFDIVAGIIHILGIQDKKPSVVYITYKKNKKEGK